MSRELQQRIVDLRSAERRFEPDAAWVRATREHLLVQVTESLPKESVRPARQVSHFFRHFIPPQLGQLFRGPVLASIFMFVAALGGSVASVSAAEHSLPGDFLYSLKLATEQARLALTPTKEDKLKLKVEFTTRRGQDLKDVAKGDDVAKPERVTQAAEILKRDLDTVKKQLDDVRATAPVQKTVEAAKLVDQRSAQLVQSLQETKGEIPANVKGKIIEAQAAAADTSVKAIEVLVEKHQESQDVIPETEVVLAIQGHTKVVADATGNALFASSTVNNLVATSSTSSATTTITLPVAVEQIKVATQTAFANEKALDDLANGSSTASGTSSASASSTPTASGTSSAALPDGTATSSQTPTSTVQSPTRSTSTPPQ